MEPPRTLLVRLPNPVGDVVMTTPLLRCLRLGLPETRLIVAGNPLFAGLLAGLDSIDAFIPLPHEGLRAHARALHATDADLALILPNSWSSALAIRLARIRLRIGRRSQGRGALLTTRLPAVGPARPMTRVYLEMLAALRIPVPRVGEEPAAELVVDQNPSLMAGAWLGVAPGAAFGPSKSYPLEQLVPAVLGICREAGLQPLLIGSPAEQALLDRAVFALRNAGLQPELPPPGGLEAAKQRIASCKLLVTMDSGARHIAAALGVPQVVLYGPTHPEWSAHSLAKTTVLRREELDCLNCHEKICPIDHRCMTRISPSDLQSAAQDRMAAEASLN
jgi:lipopolysaccharide heptosyltransferase II